MESKLERLGFKGNLAWVLNEEGSGAKFYHSSVYYPDSRTNPQTLSGITIDPGVDLGNGDRYMIDDVLREYFNQGLLTGGEYSLIKSAVGKKKLGAIDWINTNEKFFKNKFLVPNDIALKMMGNYSADGYWKYLTDQVPELNSIIVPFMAIAVHTALLSFAYNYGASRVVQLTRYYLQTRDYNKIALIIGSIKHRCNALTERRKREADLINQAIKKMNDFKIVVDENINSMPLTTIPFNLKDEIYSMNFIPEIPKPELQL